jgi:hypothetical protein
MSVPSASDAVDDRHEHAGEPAAVGVRHDPLEDRRASHVEDEVSDGGNRDRR